VRLFIVSDSPPEKDIQWSDEGISACYKFIQKLWTLHKNIMTKIKENKKIENKNDKFDQFVVSFLNKVTSNLEKFRYNVIIASFYEMYNFLSKEINQPIKVEVLKQNYVNILKTMLPFLPHFASECLKELSIDPISDNHWPKIDTKSLNSELVNIVVQINGKKREIIEIKNNCSEEEILKLVYENNKLTKFLKDNKIVKKIFVQNRLINLIIN